jgi:hypothetical protein
MLIFGSNTSERPDYFPASILDILLRVFWAGDCLIRGRL